MNIEKKKGEIKALVLDIDGVITDGTVTVSGSGDRRVFLRDLDAITMARNKDLIVAFLTGESEDDVRQLIEKCGGGPAVFNAKDKESGIREISEKLSLGLSELCYVGDARRDAPALMVAGLGLCPADGDALAKKAANLILLSSGGRGAVSEAVDLILGI